MRTHLQEGICSIAVVYYLCGNISKFGIFNLNCFRAQLCPGLTLRKSVHLSFQTAQGRSYWGLLVQEWKIQSFYRGKYSPFTEGLLIWSTVLCVLVLSEQTGMKSQNLRKLHCGIQGRHRKGRGEEHGCAGYFNNVFCKIKISVVLSGV